MKDNLIYLFLEEDILLQLLSLIGVEQKKKILKNIRNVLSINGSSYDNYSESVYDNYSEKDLSQSILYMSSVCKRQDEIRLKILNGYVESDDIDKWSPRPRKTNYNNGCVKSKIKKFEPKIIFSDIKPNNQQEVIIEHCHDNVKVDSFAGAGKSTLSSMIVQELGVEKTIYTAYLNENINDAKLRITSNAHTQCSLALKYALPASNMRHSFVKTAKAPNASSLLNVIGFEHRLDIGNKVVNYQSISSLIHKTVLNYCMSTSHDINNTHIPILVTDLAAKIKLIKWAKVYWDCLLSGRNHSEFKVGFQHIMKYWSLSPRIQLDESFYNIILDEAQDIDGAFYNVLSNHSDRNIIVIGDSYQQLFGWRGAINSMLLFDKESYPLSISYRFGQCIADHSNQLLSKHSCPPTAKIIGQSKHSSKVIFYKADSLQEINAGVILTRTKSKIIDLAEAEISRGLKVHVKTEFNIIEWMLNDIIKLRNNMFDTITHPYIQRCSSFYTLESELEDSPDPEVYFALNLFKKYGERAIGVIDLIKKNNVPESEFVKMISTTHSIKGREWDNVVIADDYEYVMSRGNADKDGELSILYVAITRAKKNVYIPESLYYLFSEHN